MQRVIFFGCSNTYGYGLDDCWPDYDSPPSKLGWAYTMANEMQKEYVNKAIPGSSNKLICHQILNTKFKPTDTVIILWTFPDRTTILSNNKKFKHLYGNKLEDPEADAYYKLLYTDYDSNFMFQLYVDCANNYLNRCGVTLYQTVTRKEHEFVLDNVSSVPVYFAEYEKYFDKAVDKSHLGVDGNVAFASDFLKYIGYTPKFKTPEPTLINRVARFVKLPKLIDRIAKFLK